MNKLPLFAIVAFIILQRASITIGGKPDNLVLLFAYLMFSDLISAIIVLASQ